uniref:PiggyBac transposable element-derived protein domain-containing protein n=1 Tax=Timema genevievae TaxID=629358 RepID=A0A7R9PSV9_TIMGE|nr:unnamed protein product [Timema genevievae]
MITNCSNNYAFQKDNIKFKVTANDIKVCLGILLLSGYCSVPRYRIYWETSSDTHNEAVSKAMSRNTFEFFISVRLLKKLKIRLHYCTETIRSNRIEKAPLEEASTLKKKVRGSYSQLKDTSSGITFIRYHDNNIVTVASTLEGAKPIGKARRWSHTEKKRIQIDQHSRIINYNCYMGVDQLDQNISSYRVNVRMKKWYCQMIMFPLNASVNNTWQLYRLAPKGKEDLIDLLSFTRYIVQTYLAKYSIRVAPGPLFPRSRTLNSNLAFSNASKTFLYS